MSEGRPLEWSMRDEAGGWVLEVRHAVPFRELLPYFARQWIVVEVAALVVAAFCGAIVLFGSGADGVGPGVAVFLVTFGALSMTYLIRSVLMGWRHQANRSVEIRVKDSSLLTPDGVFDAGCLRTVRIEGEGTHPGRRLLVFQSHSSNSAPLVGWPGISPEAADELLSHLEAKRGLE